MSAQDIIFRIATHPDVLAIVRLLADDELTGQSAREI